MHETSEAVAAASAADLQAGRIVTPAGSDFAQQWIRNIGQTSPKRGSLVDIFDDLIGLVRIFPHTNLDIEILGVTIDEVRIRCRRRPGFTVADRRLGEVREPATLAQAGDLWSLLPSACHGHGPFTTVELTQRLGKPVRFASASRTVFARLALRHRWQGGKSVDLCQELIKPIDRRALLFGSRFSPSYNRNTKYAPSCTEECDEGTFSDH